MTPARNLQLFKTARPYIINRRLWPPPRASKVPTCQFPGNKTFQQHQQQQRKLSTVSGTSTSSSIIPPNWSQYTSFPFPLFNPSPTILKMSNLPISSQAIIISTSLVTFISGFLLGIYSIRGYLISPDLKDERKHNLYDPLESEESDIDEDDTILDHAPNWANGAEADRRQGLSASSASSSKKAVGGSKQKPAAGGEKDKAALAEPENNEECKLVLVVRTDLGMTKGKIAAQCSHATLACYKTLLRAAQRKGEDSPEARLLRKWERRGQAKIAVQVKSQEELVALQQKARSVGVTAESIIDAGRTQIEAGSMTVLGVGPAPKSKVDLVTGGLKLL